MVNFFSFFLFLKLFLKVKNENIFNNSLLINQISKSEKDISIN